MLVKKRVNPKIIIALGGVFTIGSLFASSYMQSIYGFIGMYAAVNGFGQGILYMVPLITSWEWFPDSKGFATGVNLGGYGFAGFIFGLIATELVNPHNI
jgi:OFA family oxalate/formate antiporter-like MFS transporter